MYDDDSKNNASLNLFQLVPGQHRKTRCFVWETFLLQSRMPCWDVWQWSSKIHYHCQYKNKEY